MMMPAWLKNSEVEQSETMPVWLAEFRKQQWDAFIKVGLPTRRHDRFKYTDLAFLASKNLTSTKSPVPDHLSDVIHQHRLQRGESILLVMVNGNFMPTLSDVAKLPNGIMACRFDEALQTHAELVKKHWPKDIDTEQYPFASLNVAHSRNGLFLSLPNQCELSLPIHLLSLVVDQNEFIAHPQNMILLGENSKLILLEEYFSFEQHAYIMNIMTTVVAGKGAQLDHYKIQQEGLNATHMAHLFIQQEKDSSVNSTHFAFGSLFARDDIIVKLQETGATCRAAGFYHLQYDNQYIDYHLDINHSAPRTESEMLYKGILDKKSRAVFNGKLYVEKEAQKILAHQENHNLLLAENAEIYSKPELEIYADDVKCKHGATIGQLDQDALFYLRARGISHTEAMAILLQGFAEEVMQRIIHPGIKMRVQELAICL